MNENVLLNRTSSIYQDLSDETKNDIRRSNSKINMVRIVLQDLSFKKSCRVNRPILA